MEGQDSVVAIAAGMKKRMMDAGFSEKIAEKAALEMICLAIGKYTRDDPERPQSG